MFQLRRFVLVTALSIATLGLAGLSSAAAEAADQSTGGIFQALPNAAPDKTAAASFAKRPEITRSQLVRINTAAIAPSAAPNSTLQLNLFNDLVVTAVNTKIVSAQGNANGFTWIGRVTTDPVSEVVLTLNNGILAGHIQYQKVMYEIGSLGNGVQYVAQLNPAYDRPMMMPLKPPTNPNPPGVSPLTDDGSIIDIMILYTPNARTQAGGDSAIQAEITSAVATTNIGYTNSGVNTQMRLVHVGLESYTEMGNSVTDLNNLSQFGANNMTDVPTLRDQYGADLVTLITNATDVCGIAWLMTGGNTSVTFAPYGFAIVTEGFCLSSNYDLGHETGHNMGNAHDAGNAGGPGFFSYSYGYVDTVNQFRTIMAYQCNVGLGCPRINYYSNQTKTYNGHPIGNSSADNASSLNNTRTIVANFRQSIAAAPIDSIGIYRSGSFYLRLHNTTGFADFVIPFSGSSTPYPVVGDWAGAGFDTIGTFDQSNGNFHLRNSNTTGIADENFTLGNANDTPLSGRWSGSASHAGVGVYRPTNGVLYLKNALSTGFADNAMVMGLPGDAGVAGDWTGKGFDSPGIYRPSVTAYFLSNVVTNGSVFADINFTYGNASDLPIVGDWIGQGHDGAGMFRPSNGFAYLRNALTTGFADNSFFYGTAGDIPVAGHWELTYPPVAPRPPSPVLIPKLPALPGGGGMVPGDNQVGG